MFALTRDRTEDGTPDRAAPTQGPAPSCERALRVVTSASFAPVLGQLAPGLASGDNCLRVETTVVEGRAAARRAAELKADVWIPDDAAWANTAPKGLLAEEGMAGSGQVLAISPIYMVTDPATAGRINQAGGSWTALAKMLGTEKSGVRMVVRDPAQSGDGMVAAGDLAEAVWLDEDMDASALALASALRVSRTVTTKDPALPQEAGEVGLIPEYALLGSMEKLQRNVAVLAGKDYAAMLRFTWLPTAAALARPEQHEALGRLLTALTDPDVTEPIATAKLRRPRAGPPTSTRGDLLPQSSGKPFPVLKGHHVDHVFAVWYSRDRRTDLLVVLDVSGSMVEPAPGTTTPLIKLVGAGCRSIGDLLPDDARLGLWEFGSRLAPPRDYRTLVPAAPMAGGQRQKLAQALATLSAKKTGTGLYDTILEAYKSAQAAYRPGTPNQVLIFTDGRNEDDPGSISAAQLSAQLAKIARKERPVQLSVVAFGARPDVGQLEKTLKPVDGYVDPVNTPDEVAAAFLHVAAGGLHH